MKPLFLLAMGMFLLIIGGCSEEKKADEALPKDHFLRQPIDTMNDAKAVTGTVNQAIKAQEEQAARIAGHP